MITLNWKRTADQVGAGFQKIEDRFRARLAEHLYIAIGNLREYIVTQKLSGQVLHARTGNLANATQPSIYQSLDRYILTGKVSVDSTASVYGRAHEYGAHIPERVPIKKHALHWLNASGGDVFAMHAAAFDLPERSFMRSSLAEFREQIINEIKKGLTEGVTR